MCTPIPVKKPEEILAKMIEEDLEIKVVPEALRMFIRVRWERISRLAHTIHGPK